MYTVKLNRLTYYAFHGLHKQEMKCGNQFEVNLSVTQNTQLSFSNSIEQLIDYSVLKEIIDSYMLERYDLLEDICVRIISDIKSKFDIYKGEVSIKKMNPPFGGECHSSEVVIDF